MIRIKFIITLLAFISLQMASASALASDNSFKEIFQNAFYGGAAGTLVGAALMAFTKKPADHLDYMAYGAAGGVLAGAAFGLAKSARAIAEINNGKVRIAMPTIIPDLVESSSTRQSTITWRAELIRGTFQ